MQSWNEENQRLCSEAYALIGKQWAERTPNFALDDFVKLRPKTWEQIVKVEDDLDSPSSTISGVKFGIERLKNLWFDLMAVGENENKKLVKQGYKIIPTEVVGFQIYRDDSDLLKYTFVKVEQISFNSLRRFIAKEITLAEAMEDTSTPSLGGVWICDDGSVRAKAKVREKKKIETIPTAKIDEKICWKKQEEKVEDFTDIDIVGYSATPRVETVEEIEPLTPAKGKEEFDDFEITEAFD